MRKFIKVKSISGFHLVPIDGIRYVSPHKEHEGIKNKSTIFLTDNTGLYSTETQEDIFEKLEYESK